MSNRRRLRGRLIDGGPNPWAGDHRHPGHEDQAQGPGQVQVPAHGPPQPPLASGKGRGRFRVGGVGQSFRGN